MDPVPTATKGFLEEKVVVDPVVLVRPLPDCVPPVPDVIPVARTPDQPQERISKLLHNKSKIKHTSDLITFGQEETVAVLYLDLLGLLDQLEYLDHLGHLGHQGILEHRGRRGHREHLEQLGLVVWTEE